MTEYERKWLSFVEETKATDTGILNEYISDIINTAKTIADRAKGQGSDSPLSGLGRGNVKTKKEVPATAVHMQSPSLPLLLQTAKAGIRLRLLWRSSAEGQKQRGVQKARERHKKKYD